MDKAVQYWDFITCKNNIILQVILEILLDFNYYSPSEVIYS